VVITTNGPPPEAARTGSIVTSARHAEEELSDTTWCATSVWRTTPSPTWSSSRQRTWPAA